MAVARALANKPALLLADEPTGELDAATGKALIELLQSLNADGLTCVLVTHDPALARSAKRVVTMRDGQIVSDTSSDAVLPATVDVAVADATYAALASTQNATQNATADATTPEPAAPLVAAPVDAARGPGNAPSPAPRRPSLTPADADAAVGALE